MAVQLIGSESIVGTTTGEPQIEPSITGLADGRFVAMWQSFVGDQYDIRERLFDIDGTPSGGEFIVNTTRRATRTNPLSPASPTAAAGAARRRLDLRQPLMAGGKSDDTVQAEHRATEAVGIGCRPV